MEERQITKEKIVGVVNAIAVREFPQQWPELLTVLSQALQGSEACTELAFLSLAGLAERLVPRPVFHKPLPEARRKEIQQALEVHIDAIFAQHVFIMTSCLDRLHQDLSPIALAVLAAALSSVEHCSRWSPMSSVVTKQFLLLLCRILTVPALFDSACHVSQLIIVRKSPLFEAALATSFDEIPCRLH